MLNIEIDGKTVQVESGSTVMDAAHAVGAYIPHFCYHKKLSIAANCRMCLVEVEKAPKALPACATPVTDGMKVHTHSDRAAVAQKSVMEFLLINHPLDCPICDRGGECQLQDLAVGYGGSSSRYDEPKRVVVNKNLGPLIATDMTRCIHCTRCVRFGQEIAGIMELGMVGRGEHSEIMAFVDRSVDSELSGNVIDLCPVGALTNKPFRFSARTWELSRRKSVSPHDALGSNLAVQIKNDQVKRVLPLENEAINECWLSDKDRFSYEALNSEDRLTKPMLKQGGVWQEVDWQTAINYVSHALSHVQSEHGGDTIAGLFSPHATVEELYLAQKLLRGLGSKQFDSRLFDANAYADSNREGVAYLGLPVAELSTLDRALVIGSFLRKDHPLIAQRLRYAVAKRGAEVTSVHALDEDWLLPITAKAVVKPSNFTAVLAEIAVALVALKSLHEIAEFSGIEPSVNAMAIARSLASGKKSAILVGALAAQHPDAAQIQRLAQLIAELAGATFGVLPQAANSVGAALVGANATSAASILTADNTKAFMLLNIDPTLDTANPRATAAALAAAETVIAFSSFKSQAMDFADVMLPIAPFAETSGTFVNAEGIAQSFHAVVKPQGDARPLWKLLRVIANTLGVAGFDFNTSLEVKAEALPESFAERLNNHLHIPLLKPVTTSAAGLQRIADVPIYFADSLVRRASSLQKTADAKLPRARIHPLTLVQLGVTSGDVIKLLQDGGATTIAVDACTQTPEACVRLPLAHVAVAGLGAASAALSLERPL